MGYVDHAADGIAILLWSASPDKPELLVLYPFLQKYFNKGVMLGAVKG